MSHEYNCLELLSVSDLMNVMVTTTYRETSKSPSVHKPKPLTLMNHQTKTKMLTLVISVSVGGLVGSNHD